MNDVRPTAAVRRGPLRRALHRAVPAHFEDPFGLAVRLLRSGRPEAWFAMASAVATPLCAPLDLALLSAERRRLAAAAAPERPLLLVCGPPRSGTTLVAQALIASCPVAYVNNLTALFPRSPLAAQSLLRRPLRNEEVGFRSFYGRTAHLWGPNDGLHLWDRWLGRDRTRVAEALAPAARDAMRRFFAALERRFARPVVAKNNNLNAWAHLVAEALPGAHFVFLRREPLYLAQSLLVARRLIHGRDDASYGVDDPARPAPATDACADVARQVRFYARLEARQAERLGPGRMTRLAYEDFCADPGGVVERLARAQLGVAADTSRLRAAVGPASISRKRTLAPAELDRLEAALATAPPGA